MVYLSVKDHGDQLIEALQNISCYEVSLVGGDGVGSLSDSLWLYSPLVRSIIDSLNSINDNIIILPDFSHDIIKTGLDIIGGVEGELLQFNSSVKDFLELLGIDLKHVETLENSTSENDRVEFPIPIKREEDDADEDEDANDDDEEEMQKLLMAHNSGIDSSDDEKENEEDDDDDFAESPPIMNDNPKDGEEDLNIRITSVNTVKYHKDEIVNDKDSDLEQHKLKEVDDLLIEENDEWKCKVCSKTFPYKSYCRRHAEKHVSGLSYPCDFCNEIFTTRGQLTKHKQVIHLQRKKKNKKLRLSQNAKYKTNKKKIKNTMDFDGKSINLQEQKLRKVENLLSEENGAWKCKVCSKTFLSKGKLRVHAEIHVRGLTYPCDICNEILTTRSRLAQHKHNEHRRELKKLKRSPDLDYQFNIQTDLEDLRKCRVNVRRLKW